MAHITDIPTEILLIFFSHLPLKALIAARGVNQHWRNMVSHTDIPPARRAMLDLYLRILESPVFIRTRQWVLSKLKPFDRQEYLDMVLNCPYFSPGAKENLHLPEEFCLWVLEWPARAAIRWGWPGLPYHGRHKDAEEYAADIVRRNLISVKSWPENLQALSDFQYENIPVLLLRSSYPSELDPWTMVGLGLDKREGAGGKVFHLVFHEGEYEANRVYANFIEWQGRLWEMEEDSDMMASKSDDAGTDTDAKAQGGDFT